MNCPRCSEAVEPAAVFCGNCGQTLKADAVSEADADAPVSGQTPVADAAPAVTAASSLPAYAIANPAQQKAENKAMAALIFGVLALPGALIPFLGLTLAVTAIVLSTVARSAMHKKLMSTLAIVFASLGLVASIGVFIYGVQHYQAAQSGGGQVNADGSVVSAAGAGERLATPCYSVSMISALRTVDNAAGSCSAQAFNDNTLDASSNALVVEAVKQEKFTAENFAEMAKTFAGSYMADSLPDFTVTAQSTGVFAGSPAYTVDAKKNGQNTTIQLALVYRPVANGESLFILAHAIDNGQAGLEDFEKTWIWK